MVPSSMHKAWRANRHRRQGCGCVGGASSTTEGREERRGWADRHTKRTHAGEKQTQHDKTQANQRTMPPSLWWRRPKAEMQPSFDCTARGPSSFCFRSEWNSSTAQASLAVPAERNSSASAPATRSLSPLFSVYTRQHRQCVCMERGRERGQGGGRESTHTHTHTHSLSLF